MSNNSTSSIPSVSEIKQETKHTRDANALAAKTQVILPDTRMTVPFRFGEDNINRITSSRFLQGVLKSTLTTMEEFINHPVVDSFINVQANDSTKNSLTRKRDILNKFTDLYSDQSTPIYMRISELTKLYHDFGKLYNQYKSSMDETLDFFRNMHEGDIQKGKLNVIAPPHMLYKYLIVDFKSDLAQTFKKNIELSNLSGFEDFMVKDFITSITLERITKDLSVLTWTPKSIINNEYETHVQTNNLYYLEGVTSEVIEKLFNIGSSDQYKNITELTFEKNLTPEQKLLREHLSKKDFKKATKLIKNVDFTYSSVEDLYRFDFETNRENGVPRKVYMYIPADAVEKEFPALYQKIGFARRDEQRRLATLGLHSDVLDVLETKLGLYSPYLTLLGVDATIRYDTEFEDPTDLTKKKRKVTFNFTHGDTNFTTNLDMIADTDFEFDTALQAALRAVFRTVKKKDFGSNINLQDFEKNFQYEYAKVMMRSVPYHTTFSSDVFKPYIYGEHVKPAQLYLENLDNLTQEILNKQTFWDAVVSGGAMLWHNTVYSFSEYYKQYGRDFSAIMSLDLNLLNPTTEEALKAYYEYKEATYRNYIFAAPGDETDLFSKYGISQLIGNTGFTVGTISAFVVETAALALMTEGIGGFANLAKAGRLGITIERLGQTSKLLRGTHSYVQGFTKTGQLGRLTAEELSMLSRASKFGETRQILRNMSTAERISMAKNLETATQLAGEGFQTTATKSGRFFNTVADFIPVVAEGKDIYQTIRAGRMVGVSSAEIAGAVTRSLFEGLRVNNMALQESYIESSMLVGEMYEAYVHSLATGLTPSSVDEERFLTNLELASKQTLWWNYFALYFMNKIQLDFLFKSPMLQGSIMENLVKGQELGRVFVVNANNTSKAYALPRWFTAFRTSRAVYKDFGFKPAMKTFVKLSARPLSKFQLLEGVQEIYQEMVSQYWLNYGMDRYEQRNSTFTELFSHSLKEFSPYMFITFAQGATTGFMLSPFSSGMSIIGEKYQMRQIEKKYGKDSKEYKEIQDRFNAVAEIYNSYFSTPSAASGQSNNLGLLIDQVNKLNEMQNALTTNNFDKYIELRIKGMLDHILKMKNAGLDQYFILNVRKIAENLDDQMVQQMLGLQNLTADQVKQYKQDLENAANTLEKYVEKIDEAQFALSKLMMPMLTQTDEILDEESIKELQNMQNIALDYVATMTVLNDELKNEFEKMYNEIKDLNIFKELSFETFRLFADISELNTQINDTETKIKHTKSLYESVKDTNKELAKQYQTEIKNLEEYLEKLTDFKKNYYDEKNITLNVNSSDEAQVDNYIKSVTELLNSKNKVENKIITDETEVIQDQLQSVKHKFISAVKLNLKHSQYTSKVDILSRPEAFKAQTRARYLGNLKLIASQRIAETEEFLRKTLIETVLKEFGHKNVHLENLSAEELKQVNENFLAIVNSDPILKELYEKYKELILFRLKETKEYKDLLNFINDKSEKLIPVKDVRKLIADYETAAFNDFISIIDAFESKEMYERYKVTENDLNKPGRISFEHVAKLYVVARKLMADNATLTDAEKTFYKENKEVIDNIISNLKASKKADKYKQIATESLKSPFEKLSGVFAGLVDKINELKNKTTQEQKAEVSKAKEKLEEKTQAAQQAAPQQTAAQQQETGSTSETSKETKSNNEKIISKFIDDLILAIAPEYQTDMQIKEELLEHILSKIKDAYTVNEETLVQILENYKEELITALQTIMQISQAEPESNIPEGLMPKSKDTKSESKEEEIDSNIPVELQKSIEEKNRVNTNLTQAAVGSQSVLKRATIKKSDEILTESEKISIFDQLRNLKKC